MTTFDEGRRARGRVPLLHDAAEVSEHHIARTTYNSSHRPSPACVRVRKG